MDRNEFRFVNHARSNRPWGDTAVGEERRVNQQWNRRLVDRLSFSTWLSEAFLVWKPNKSPSFQTKDAFWKVCAVDKMHILNSESRYDPKVKKRIS